MTLLTLITDTLCQSNQQTINHKFNKNQWTMQTSSSISLVWAADRQKRAREAMIGTTGNPTAAISKPRARHSRLNALWTTDMHGVNSTYYYRHYLCQKLNILQARCDSALFCLNMWKTNYRHRHVNSIALHVFVAGTVKLQIFDTNKPDFSPLKQGSNWQHQLGLASYSW